MSCYTKSGYVRGDLIRENVYKVCKDKDCDSFVVKQTKNPNGIEFKVNDYLNQVDPEGLIHPRLIEFPGCNDPKSLVFENAGLYNVGEMVLKMRGFKEAGRPIPVEEFHGLKPFEVEQFINAYINWFHKMIEYNAKHDMYDSEGNLLLVIHYNINPLNIIYNPKKHQLFLIDWSSDKQWTVHQERWVDDFMHLSEFVEILLYFYENDFFLNRVLSKLYSFDFIRELESEIRRARKTRVYFLDDLFHAYQDTKDPSYKQLHESNYSQALLALCQNLYDRYKKSIFSIDRPFHISDVEFHVNEPVNPIQLPAKSSTKKATEKEMHFFRDSFLPLLSLMKDIFEWDLSTTNSILENMCKIWGFSNPGDIQKQFAEIDGIHIELFYQTLESTESIATYGLPIEEIKIRIQTGRIILGQRLGHSYLNPFAIRLYMEQLRE